MIDVKPSDTYEGLKTQFFALKRIIQSKQAEVDVYYKTIQRFNMERVIKLEAELESQKEMNAILTNELQKHEQYENLS